MNLCECGCGAIVKNRFVSGHNSRIEHPTYKNGRTIINNRIYVLSHEHPRADKNNRVGEHILIAEAIIGKILPDRCVIHHHNKSPADNRNENLVICENQAYHILLHKRTRALKESGYANWIKCPICKKYDDPENLYIRPNSLNGYHRKCSNKYDRGWRKWKKTKNH